MHILLQSFMNRVFNAGILAMAVVAEKYTVELDTRKAHAAAFNDCNMHYVLNAHISEQERRLTATRQRQDLLVLSELVLPIPH